MVGVELPTCCAGEMGEAVFAFGQSLKVAGFQVARLQGFVLQAPLHGLENGAPVEGEGFLLWVKDLQHDAADAKIGCIEKGGFKRVDVAHEVRDKQRT